MPHPPLPVRHLTDVLLKADNHNGLLWESALQDGVSGPALQ